MRLLPPVFVAAAVLFGNATGQPSRPAQSPQTAVWAPETAAVAGPAPTPPPFLGEALDVAQPTPAVRVATRQVNAGAPASPPAAPLGAHCVNLLPAYLDARWIEAGQPESMDWQAVADTFTWYGNVALGESNCREAAMNPVLPGGTWGAWQIHWQSWSRACSWLPGAASLNDPVMALGCVFAVERAGGRRQWAPHDPVSGCFPRGVGRQC